MKKYGQNYLSINFLTTKSLYNLMLQRLPAVFLNHGGGPMPILYPEEHKPLYESYKAISLLFPAPIAIIVISAHWIEK